MLRPTQKAGLLSSQLAGSMAAEARQPLLEDVDVERQASGARLQQLRSISAAVHSSSLASAAVRLRIVKPCGCNTLSRPFITQADSRGNCVLVPQLWIYLQRCALHRRMRAPQVVLSVGRHDAGPHGQGMHAVRALAPIAAPSSNACHCCGTLCTAAAVSRHAFRPVCPPPPRRRSSGSCS